MSKPKRPRKSTKKRGVFKLTPKKIKAVRAMSASGADVTDAAREAFDFPTDEEFMRV